MSILKATEARANLYNLIDETADSHRPIITGKRNNAVLLSEEDWNAIICIFNKRLKIYFSNIVAVRIKCRSMSGITLAGYGSSTDLTRYK